MATAIFPPSHCHLSASAHPSGLALSISLLHPHSGFLKSSPTTIALFVRRNQRGGIHSGGQMGEDGAFPEPTHNAGSVAEKNLNKNESDESKHRRTRQLGAHNKLGLDPGHRKLNLKEWDDNPGSAVSQNASISSRRLSSSTGSRSRPSQSSIPGTHSKYSKQAKPNSWNDDGQILQSSILGKCSEQTSLGTAMGYLGYSSTFSHVPTFKPEERATSDVELSDAEGDLEFDDFPSSSNGYNFRADSSSCLSLSNQSKQGADSVILQTEGSLSSERKKGFNFKPERFPTSQNGSSTLLKVVASTENPGHAVSDLAFEPQYSYSEIPKVAPVGYREPQYSPFGPSTLGRPWTGRAPLKPSKKKLPEFDSFHPPPRGKKGVKYVQDPGPFPENQGPREVKSREEIIGEPLSEKEVQGLVASCLRERRQINLGRDGLIHNMLDLIHAHWKRRRVCRIKCIGVPTVDMDNVCFHIEEKTGGKIIHRAGGVVYLFRGRYYNYRDRPRIPIMLWKPAAPIYPKLIKPAPGGLTKEEAAGLRRIGRKVVPICKLGKNGVYLNLVKDVRDAFRVDELARVNCQGLNPSDYKKIGAKLKELVPCVLLSFENEHLLMWRGRDLNSEPVVDKARIMQTTSILPSSERTPLLEVDPAVSEQIDDSIVEYMPFSDPGGAPSSPDEDTVLKQNDKACVPAMLVSEDGGTPVESYGQAMPVLVEANEVEGDFEDVDVLWRQAIGSGTALVLEDKDLDADFLLEKAVEFAKVAPCTPPYKRSLLHVLKCVDNETEQNTDDETKARKRQVKRRAKKTTMQILDPPLLEVPPLGGLGIDELARLLSR